ncbi:MAG: GGDEF domain-containing protein [Myxococcales bacterium]|nr:MAG: GGDEF domain-containing protein [Myxococcales bacterium]
MSAGVATLHTEGLSISRMNRSKSEEQRFTEPDAKRIKFSTLGAALIAMAGICVVTIVDYTTGGKVGLSPFYIAVISFVTWWAGLYWGIAMASLATLGWFAAIVPWRQPHEWFVEGINAGMRSIIFIAFAFLVARIRRDQQRLERLNIVLKGAIARESSNARTDVLTGLLNRRGFQEQVEREIARCMRQSAPLSVGYLDIDNFKRINDSKGHEWGDACLCEVASALVSMLRPSDVSARLGGDEFAMLLPMTDLAAAEQVAGRLHTVMQSKLRDYGDADLGISLGVVSFNTPPSTVSELFRQADATMYRAKQAGKGRVIVAQGQEALVE